MQYQYNSFKHENIDVNQTVVLPNSEADILALSVKNFNSFNKEFGFDDVRTSSSCLFDDFNLNVCHMYNQIEEQLIKPNIILENEVISCIGGQGKKSFDTLETSATIDDLIQKDNIIKSFDKKKVEKNCNNITLKKKEENYMKIITSLVTNCISEENLEERLNFLGKKI